MTFDLLLKTKNAAIKKSATEIPVISITLFSINSFTSVPKLVGGWVVGNLVGDLVGDLVGNLVGNLVGDLVGNIVGGGVVGEVVGKYV